MCFAAELAKIKVNLSEQIVEQHYAVLKALKLPTKYQASAWPELLAAMSLDKKTKSGTLRFVAIDDVGKCVRIESPTSDELASAYERIAE